MTRLMITGSAKATVRSVALLAALAVGGCMRPPEVIEFANGVACSGPPGGDFVTVSWVSRPGNNNPPPIVVHLPDGDVANATLVDPKALLGRCWVSEDRGVGVTVLSVTRDGLWVASVFAQGRWVGVDVNAGNLRGQAQNIATIDGKKVSLPSTEADLSRLFGNPVARHPKR